MKTKLTARAHVLNDDGATPWDDVPDNKRKAVLEKMSERVGRELTDYYSQHIDEYKEIAV